jgi:hypothetical protein
MAKGFERLLEVAGEQREIVYLNSSGAQISATVNVIWSNEALRQDPIAEVGSGNVYYKGDVLLTIRKSDFDGLPNRSHLQSPSVTGFMSRMSSMIMRHGA